MIVRVGTPLACLAMVLTQVGPAGAAPTRQPTPPHRILLVGDSTAETMYPYLRDAGAVHGVEVFSAAVLGCSVIDGRPDLDNGQPYVDTVGDTRRCAGT